MRFCVCEGSRGRVGRGVLLRNGWSHLFTYIYVSMYPSGLIGHRRFSMRARYRCIVFFRVSPQGGVCVGVEGSMRFKNRPFTSCIDVYVHTADLSGYSGYSMHNRYRCARRISPPGADVPRICITLSHLWSMTNILISKCPVLTFYPPWFLPSFDRLSS